MTPALGFKPKSILFHSSSLSLTLPIELRWDVFMRENKRYRQENDTYCIDIYLTSILQLFDRRDPSPFKEKDLDEDFSRYLILSMNELRDAKKVKLAIKMPEHHPAFLKEKDIEEALYTYYSFEEENSRSDMVMLFRQGRHALLIGLSFLSLFYIGYFFTKDAHSWLIGLIAEGFHVLGWVAMWKPINIFLYEWWPIRDRINLMGRLQKLKVEIVTG